MTEDTFETAADAVIEGRLAELQALLRDKPSLATARSQREHHATLLHYDRHFDLIAESTGQPAEWLARRGSLD